MSALSRLEAAHKLRYGSVAKKEVLRRRKGEAGQKRQADSCNL